MNSTIQNYARGFVAWGQKMGWWKIAVAGIVIVIGIGFATTFGSKAAEQTPAITTPEVSVKSVADLSADVAPLSVVGSVNSKSEATVRAEKSGQAIAVYKALGDNIAAGEIAAEIEDASERAAVLQAQGSVDAAQANLDKTTGGARSEQLAILQAAKEAAQSGAVNALLSAYAAVDNAVGGTADAMFSNPDGNVPQFSVLSSDSQLKSNIENERVKLAATLTREASASGSVTASSDLVQESSQAEVELRDVRAFLDDIISQLNKGIPTQTVSATTIATYQAGAVAARTAITTGLSSIASARQNLETAVKNLEQGVTGGQSEDVAGAKATLKQAEGALAAAQANLEKSIIRAPISGTINSFSLKRGDFVQASSPVLTVANNGALEIVAYLTENDAHDIAIGANASIENGATGVVTRLAPALDPVTKKIEIRIGVADPQKTLINGQSVLVNITRTATHTTGEPSRISIPISAIKVGSDTATIFIVDENHLLVAHQVTLGALLGDRVVIAEGLTLDMQIVTDARGLREGQAVEVK